MHLYFLFCDNLVPHNYCIADLAKYFNIIRPVLLSNSLIIIYSLIY